MRKCHGFEGFEVVAEILCGKFLKFRGHGLIRVATSERKRGQRTERGQGHFLEL